MISPLKSQQMSIITPRNERQSQRVPLRRTREEFETDFNTEPTYVNAALRPTVRFKPLQGEPAIRPEYRSTVLHNEDRLLGNNVQNSTVNNQLMGQQFEREIIQTKENL